MIYNVNLTVCYHSVPVFMQSNAHVFTGNIAYSKYASQGPPGSYASVNAPQLAIDGATGRDLSGGQCAQTSGVGGNSGTPSGYWILDLVLPHVIHSVEIIFPSGVVPSKCVVPIHCYTSLDGQNCMLDMWVRGGGGASHRKTNLLFNQRSARTVIMIRVCICIY